MWSDSLDYYRDNGYALLKHNVQIDDVKNKVLVLSDWGEYWKEPGNAFLTNNPVLVSYDAEQGDSLYIRSDSMYLYTRDPVAERIERERIARHIADSIALADSLQRVAQMAEAEKVVKKDDEQVDKSEQGPMKNKQRQDLARNSLDKNKRDRRSRGDEQQEQQELNEHQELQIAEEQVEEQVEEQQGADSLAVDSLVKDSLALDSLINPIDTLTDKQRKALAKLAEKEAKQQLRDSLRKIKEDSLRVKLDRIADARQAKRTAYYKNLERIDSLNRVKAQARADKKLRRRIARLNRKGISILPVHDSIFRKADSVAMAELLGLEAVTGRVLDSLIDIYYPKLADTTAMATDTIPVDSTYKMIIALRNVRMFRSDAQMVCDSLVSRSTDSIIHLYKTPVLWSEANQITSDSMHIFSHEGRLVKAMFDGHPLIVAELDTAHYNQVTGKEMVSYFNDKNELYRNDVKGNVQTIYYMQEQDSPEITMMAYVESGDMTAYLENRQLKGITYRTNPTYFFYPIDKIPESQPTKLDNFKWEGNRRPARDSVLNRTIRPSERDKRKSLLLPNFPIERALNMRKQRLINQGSWMDRTDTLSIETIEWVESVQD